MTETCKGVITINTLKDNITIEIVTFLKEFQHDVYNFVWNNMRNVLNRDPSKLKEELILLEDIYKNYIEEGGNFWIATHSNQIVGTIGLKKLNNEIYELRRFYVDSNYRGKQSGLCLWHKCRGN